jgi:excisionase family DNA binding protein
VLERLPAWSWDPYADSWDRHYEKLVGFVERTGSARVPERHIEDELRLGQWVRAQRRFRRRGTLREDRTRRLEALPGWSWGSSANGLGPKKPSTVQPGGPSRSVVRPEERDGEWVDAEGAGSLCGLSHQTVYRLIEDGRLPASRRAGQVQIRRTDVATLIESSRIVPGSLRRTP